MDVMKYRPEIDGLRALAVLPVVLYHAGGGAWLPGGFMGVDVFFVISGYLITRIIWGELEAGSFSIGRFYERRFRRIVPALLAVLVVVIAFALVYALPAQVVDIDKSAIAALFSVSNFWFWTQSGYFAPAVEFMPLLHTWSLAVEEQFYLVFPLVLMLVNFLKLDVRKWLLWSLPLLYLVALYLSIEKPAVAFYLLPARAWELALGGVLGVSAIPAVRNPRVATWLAAIGLLMLCVGYLFGHSGMLFPGYLALLPCMGAALVIHCTRADSLPGRLLAWRPMVFIGLISYSLYLWHWPILVFARMATAKVDLAMPVAVLAVGLSLLAAVLSWRFVEQPFRHRRLALRPALAYAGLATMVIAVSATIGIRSQGYPGRLSDQASSAIAVQRDLDPLRAPCAGVTTALPKCTFGTSVASRYIVAGDSHAAAMRPAFDAVPALKGRRGELWWRGACALLIGVKTYPDADSAECVAFREQAMLELERRSDVETVILVGRWPSYLLGQNPETGGSYRTFLIDVEGNTQPSAESTARLFQESLTRTVERIVRSGKAVVLVGTVPEPGFDVPVLSALAIHNGIERGVTIPRVVVEERNRAVDKILSAIDAGNDRVTYVRVWDTFCDAARCATQFDGRPAYSDDDHVSFLFARDTLGALLASRWPKRMSSGSLPDRP